MIGQSINRVDGPVKVTGKATYAYEYGHDEAPLYGVIVTATIGRGRIREIDSAQAEKSPGVHVVVTHQNSPAQGDRNAPSSSGRRDARAGPGGGEPCAHSICAGARALRPEGRYREGVRAEVTDLRHTDR